MNRGEPEWYVYALVPPGLPPALRVRNRRLHVLRLGAFDAVVTRAQPPGAATVDAGLLRAQHDIVVALDARVPALLPARFGTRVEGGLLRTLARSRAAEVSRALEQVRGHCQMTIRLFGDARERDAAPAAHYETGTGYLLARRARLAAPAEVSVVRAAVRRYFDAERVEPGQGELRATVFHLVPRHAVDRYRRAAADVRLPTLRLAVTGPWPPFAFAPDLTAPAAEARPQ